MSDELDDLGDLESAVNGNDLDVAISEKEDSVSGKQRAIFDLDARRRVELKLEEVCIRRQIEAYDLDDDFD
ncbi:MAG: hypothetical protein ACI89A_000368 [Porticoccaceae bacterium]|jgi:hypothetical protein